MFKAVLFPQVHFTWCIDSWHLTKHKEMLLGHNCHSIGAMPVSQRLQVILHLVEPAEHYEINVTSESLTCRFE